MTMRIKICSLCVAVSLSWLLIHAGLVFGLLGGEGWKLFSALLMGGSVTGLGYAGLNPTFIRKTIAVSVGMPISYLLLVNLSKTTVIVEFAIMLSLAVLLFRVKTRPQYGGRVSDIKEQLKKCC